MLKTARLAVDGRQKCACTERPTIPGAELSKTQGKHGPRRQAGYDQNARRLSR